jgi:PAS domain S-box-containing protein
MTMNILFDWLLPQNFLPHGHCYLWRPDVLWLHVISDAVIAASYYAIPLALAYFVHRRRAVLPYWWMPVLFAMFIFLCGTTHVLNIWTVWRPDYIVDGLVKLATALASASTAVLVFAALPQAVALRTPIELQAEVETRTGELRAAKTYAEIAGIPLQQIIGRPIIDVMGREGFEKIRPYVERVLQGESVEYETPVPFSRGGTRLLHVAYAPWREADGSVSGWVASVTDVTARHRAEEKLKAASRQKDEFLAMLAHELRNPLAPICNATVLLERWLGSNAEAKAPLAILRRQTRQLIRLVDDLLDVARISEGQINLKKETIEIGAVLDQAVEMIQLLVQAKLHRLNIHKPFSPVYVHGDFARLVQSLGNILHNAAKYTDLGGEIEVDVKESSGELMIAVRDTGSGIAPDLLPNVFDLFIQGHSTADRAEGGLGIGLTVVKKIIQLHGGSVSADSPGVGCGTTVTVNLPTVESASAPEPEDVRFIASRRRVLVVDDNEDAANSLAMMLRLEGHEVSTVFSASGALSAADRSKPEIIFLDIGLPQMDGYEVARRLRAQLGSACPRLIALTGYGQPEDRARARTVGFAAHVTKPIDLQRLQQVLSANSDPAATAT